MRHEIKAETSSAMIKELRGVLGASQEDLSRRTWFARTLIARIESGREPRLPTMRRLIGALGGRLELAARFERPLEALAEDFLDGRIRAQQERDRRRHERNMARWAARTASRTAA